MFLCMLSIFITCPLYWQPLFCAFLLYHNEMILLFPFTIGLIYVIFCLFTACNDYILSIFLIFNVCARIFFYFI